MFSGKCLFVVVVAFNFDYQHDKNVIIDVIDDAVVSSDVTGISHVITANEGFRVSESSTRMIHQLIIDFLVFLP